MKSMWFEMRKKAGKTQRDIANEFGVSTQYVQKIECGEANMPIKYQIYYLSLRNEESDKKIIEYLKELQSKRKEGY